MFGYAVLEASSLGDREWLHFLDLSNLVRRANSHVANGGEQRGVVEQFVVARAIE